MSEKSTAIITSSGLPGGTRLGVIENILEDVVTVRLITEEKLVGSRAAVRYRKTADEKIQITGFDGFLTREGIVSRYGSEVSRIYFEGAFANMTGGLARPDRPMVEVYIQNSHQNAMVGAFYTQGEFQALIAAMKKCGARLSRIIKDVRAAERAAEKTIFI